MHAVLIVDSGGITGADEVFQVVGLTIVFSVVLHGLSAAPPSRQYGGYVDRALPEDAPERAEVSELSARLPPHRGRTAAEETSGRALRKPLLQHGPWGTWSMEVPLSVPSRWLRLMVSL